jgi:iron complex outermembrane receptor protein
MLTDAYAVYAADASEEIVVTARRKEEKLQDVPISIAVFNQKQLDERNVMSIKDLAAYTPSLSVDNRFGTENAAFSIRGFVQDLLTAPSVAVYFADVVAPRGASSIAGGEGAGPGNFFDLQTVQVLKGPQGTLFGRNTTGGAILFVPKKPTSEFGGYIEGGYGNYNMERLQGVMNVPLGTKARMRLGFDQQTRDGYLKNIGVGPSRMNNVNYVAGRASFVVDITPDIENYTIGSVVHSDNTGQTLKATGCRAAGTSGGGSPTGQMQCTQIARENATGDFFTIVNPIPDPLSVLDQWQVVNTTTWHVTDHFMIKNIASYAQIRNQLRTDPIGTGWIIPSGVGAGQYIALNFATTDPRVPQEHQSTTTEELQFQGNGLNHRFVWQAGAVIELSDPLSAWTGNLNPALAVCSDPVNFQCFSPYGASGALGSEVRRTSYRDFGFYGQASYDITSKVKFTGGLRFTDDRSRGESLAKKWTFAAPNVPNAPTCNSFGAVPPVCASSTRQNSHAVTWLAQFEFRPVEDVMLYIKNARGYRQGLANPRGIDPYTSFGPEKIDSFELGGKTEWHGRMPGTFNFAAFYNSFSNQQLFFSFRSGSTSASIISNIGNARVWGVEADANLNPFEGFRLTGAFTYLNTLEGKYNLPAAPPNFASPVLTARALPGWPLTYAPEFKESVTAAYTLPLADTVGEVQLSTTFSYSDSYITTPTIPTLGKIPSVALLNLNMNWSSMFGSPVDLAVFATNVTDTHYTMFASDQLSSVGSAQRTLGEPQMFGARVKYRFGSDAH